MTTATDVTTHQIDSPVGQFVTVAVFLWLLALIPLAIHPQVRKHARQTCIYLIGAVLVSVVIVTVGMTPAAGLAAPLLLAYWGALLFWTVRSITARVRIAGLNHRHRHDMEILARFEKETGGPNT